MTITAPSSSPSGKPSAGRCSAPSSVCRVYSSSVFRTWRGCHHFYEVFPDVPKPGRVLPNPGYPFVTELSICFHHWAVCELLGWVVGWMEGTFLSSVASKCLRLPHKHLLLLSFPAECPRAPQTPPVPIYPKYALFLLSFELGDDFTTH